MSKIKLSELICIQCLPIPIETVSVICVLCKQDVEIINSNSMTHYIMDELKLIYI